MVTRLSKGRERVRTRSLRILIGLLALAVAGGAGCQGTESDSQAPSAAAERLPAFGEYVYVEHLPEAARRVAPKYPERARLDGVEGTVLVQVLIDRQGVVRDTRVVSSVAPLDTAAVEAARQWRFKPAMARGEPVAVWVAVPVKFSLR